MLGFSLTSCCDGGGAQHIRRENLTGSNNVLLGSGSLHVVLHGGRGTMEEGKREVSILSYIAGIGCCIAGAGSCIAYATYYDMVNLGE